MDWADARVFLSFSLAHAVGEYWEPMTHLKKHRPSPSAKDKALQVSTSSTDRRDLEMMMMMMDFSTLERMSRKMGNPMVMILTQQVRTSSMSRMGAFGKIFLMPDVGDAASTKPCPL